MPDRATYYYFDYLKQNYPVDKEILASLKFELDRRIYHYGNQFSSPLDGPMGGMEVGKTVQIYSERLKYILRFVRGLFRQYPVNDRPKIISNAHFSFNSELENLGYNVFLPPWIKQFIRGYPPRSIKHELDALNRALSADGLNELIAERFSKQVISAEAKFKEFYVKNGFCALCVDHDVTFFENRALKIFREINKPSFIFQHGFTQQYDGMYENRSDYLIVWGEKMKENYVQGGIRRDKIFVAGHPNYQDYQAKDLRFGLDNVLVLTNSLISMHFDNLGVVLHDRGNSIIYLYSIQKILTKLGVKHVRLRPHPSENAAWYKKYIDLSFYKIDQGTLKDSLGQASIVLGPFSTTFLETLYYGANYVVYEPSINGHTWNSKYPLMRSFDGSDPRIPVAKNEEQLLSILKNKMAVDPSIFNEYVRTPFNLGFMKKLIAEYK